MGKLAETLKILRTMRGFTQKQLAESLDKTVNSVANWEKNMVAPDSNTLEQICQILNVTPNELLGWEENQEQKVFLAELNEAIAYKKQVINIRIAQDKIYHSYSEKFGKLLNSNIKI